jgi:glycosyltransferase involved in cell wall biosynthesis
MESSSFARPSRAFCVRPLTHLELIVINDGAIDATADILDCCQQKDSRVRVFQQNNAGLIKSLNRAAGFARGKYIARMDADDIAVPNRLALQVSVLEQHDEIGVLGGRSR